MDHLHRGHVQQRAYLGVRVRVRDRDRVRVRVRVRVSVTISAEATRTVKGRPTASMVDRPSS